MTRPGVLQTAAAAVLFAWEHFFLYEPLSPGAEPHQEVTSVQSCKRATLVVTPHLLAFLVQALIFSKSRKAFFQQAFWKSMAGFKLFLLITV